MSTQAQPGGTTTQDWLDNLEWIRLRQITLVPEDDGGTFHDGTRTPFVTAPRTLDHVEACFRDGWVLVRQDNTVDAYPASQVQHIRVIGQPQ